VVCPYGGPFAEDDTGQSCRKGPLLLGVEALITFDVKSIREGFPFGISKGDVESWRIQDALDLCVDQLQDVIDRYRKVGGLCDQVKRLEFGFTAFR